MNEKKYFVQNVSQTMFVWLRTNIIVGLVGVNGSWLKMRRQGIDRLPSATARRNS